MNAGLPVAINSVWRMTDPRFRHIRIQVLEINHSTDDFVGVNIDKLGNPWSIQGKFRYHLRHLRHGDAWVPDDTGLPPPKSAAPAEIEEEAI